MQRRMLHAKMLENPDFGTLTPNAKILYIFCIVLADDDGRLKANATALRGRVFAFDLKIKDSDVRTYLNEIVKKRLVIWYKIDDEYFIQHPNWARYQILRSDRKKNSDIPPPDDNQVATKRGRSKQVSKKEKEENHISYLKKIPEKDLEELYIRFDASKSAIQKKAEDLFLWCKSNGKIKKNYRAFLLMALRKDFPIRKTPPRTMAPEKPKEIEPESDRKPIPQEMKDSIQKIIGKMKQN